MLKDRDVDRLTEVAEEVLWHLEKGKEPVEIARLLSKKHKTQLQPMLQFVTQLQMMARRVVYGDTTNIRMH